MTQWRCNLDDSVLMDSEAEARNFLIKFSKHFYNNKTHQVKTDTMVQFISPQQWKQDMKLKARGFDYPTIVGWDEYTILHDPTLVENLDDLKVK